MNRIKSILTLAAFSLLVLGLPVVASAQYGNGGYGNGGYGNPGYGNGGYGNGGYGNYGDARGTIRNLKQRADRFESLTDRNDRYDRNGRYSNQSIEDLADQFKKATDKLEDAYGKGRNLNNSADEARRVLDLGSQIDQMMYYTRSNNGRYNSGYNNSAVSMWNLIRNDLQVVSNIYGYGYYNNNNRYPQSYPNRGGNYPNTRNNYPNVNKPSWWPF